MYSLLRSVLVILKLSFSIYIVVTFIPEFTSLFSSFFPWAFVYVHIVYKYMLQIQVPNDAIKGCISLRSRAALLQKNPRSAHDYSAIFRASRGTIAIDHPRDDFRRSELAAPARFALALSISISRFYPAWAGVSVGVPHFSGKWESIWRTPLRNCSWQHALCLYVPEHHRVIPLVSHSDGSTPRAFLLPSRSSKRALFHCPRDIFTTICALRHCFLIFFVPLPIQNIRSFLNEYFWFIILSD